MARNPLLISCSDSMASLPTDESARTLSSLRQRVPLFKILGTADDAIYSLERFIVVASLIIMTQASFMKVLSDFLAKLEAGYLFYGITFAAVFVIARVATGASPTIGKNSTQASLWALIVTVLCVGYLALIQTQESSVVVAVTALAMGGTSIVVNVRSAKDLGWTLGLVLSTALVVAMTLGVALLSTRFDEGLGYSWAPNIALTLLLWMAFLGASMATHDKRHLALDAVRKIVPAKHTRLYAALSFVVSAIVTAAFFYLSYTYFGKRIAEEPEPGKIPDWIKVMSIPVALGTMTVRFFAYAIAEFVGYFLGVEPDAAPASGMPIPAAPAEKEEVTV